MKKEKKQNSSLPEGWKEYKLEDNDVSEMIMGQSPPSNTYNDNGNGLPFFQGKTDFGTIYPSIRKWCSFPIKKSKINDILISVRAPVGDVNICQEESCIGRGLAAIRCKKLCDYRFLFLYLLNIKDKIKILGTGTIFQSMLKTW